MKSGEFWRKAREESGFRNKDVVNKLGISTGRLSSIELYDMDPGDWVEKLAALYGVDPAKAPKPTKAKRRRKAVPATPAANTRCTLLANWAKQAIELGETDLALEVLALSAK